MKKRQLIFFGVLALAIFFIAACVQPGEAVARKVVQKQIAPAAPIGGFCAKTGQGCGPLAGNKSCCSGLTCNPRGICINLTTPGCTPSTICSGSYLNTTYANCTKTSTLCQYGCSSGACNPPPSQNCTASTICYSGTYLNVTTSNCTKSTIPCTYGCNIGSSICNSAPANCTPSYTCVGNSSIFTNSTCINTTTSCQYGCNQTSGRCYLNQTCTPAYSCIGNNSYYTGTNCITFLYQTCNFGCNQGTGQCKANCTDSDGGIVPTVYGVVTDVSQTYPDFCPYGNGVPIVTENYCTGTSRSVVILNCTGNQTCMNGQCQ